MELKAGYKQTEVGVIPEDWEIKRLGEFATIATGNTPPTADATNYGDEFLFVSPGDLGEAKNVTSTEKRLSKKGFASARRFPKNSVLFVCIGSTIGKCGVASVELTSNQQINAVFPGPSFSADFLYYACCAAAPNVKSLAGEQAVPLVNKTQFSATTVAMPLLTEQEAIAEALSDADALIESLDQLITKKRYLKQGAMQELLTGKRRLPGISKTGKLKQTDAGLIPEDWEAPTLDEILKSIQLGGNYKNSERVTNWPLIKMGNLARGSITLDKLEFVDAEASPAARDRLSRGDILFNTRNTMDLVGKVAIWRDELPEAYFNSNLMRMQFDTSRVSSSWFMSSILNTRQTISKLRGIATGTTSVAAIYSRDFCRISVPLPPRGEQTAIATILSDMDTELAELVSRLAKARQIKQGMMQELLTGRIRLL